MVKNKLHIFGCSHSTHIHCEIPGEEVKWWGPTLADSLGLEFYPMEGNTGKNVEYILLSIYDRMINGHISKDDVVVLNTSYPLRYGSPRLQQFADVAASDRDDTGFKNRIKDYHDHNKDELNEKLTFDLWYKQTYGAWKLLDSICDNVFQWTLLPTDDLDAMHQEIHQSISKGIPGERIADVYCIQYPITIQKTGLNNWDGLIPPPRGFTDWDKWIMEVPFTWNDGHMHPSRHIVFAELIYNHINGNKRN